MSGSVGAFQGRYRLFVASAALSRGTLALQHHGAGSGGTFDYGAL